MRRPVLPLEAGIVYGPLVSRRLGLSLGVNVLPADVKVCSFDCIYCHYGPTGARVPCVKAGDPIVALLPTVHAVVRAVEAALRAHPEVTAITFSGNGEPTLHPHFPNLAFEVRRLRDRLCPDAKVALFSNATRAADPAVRDALQHIDLPILKLDAGTPDLFQRVNRPAPGIELEALVAGLRDIDHLIIQSVFVDGAVSNTGDAAVAAWLDRLAESRPVAVQIYSTDYPVAATDVRRVPPYLLRRLAGNAGQVLGLPVRAYWVA